MLSVSTMAQEVTWARERTSLIFPSSPLPPPCAASPSLLDAASSLVDGYTVKEDEEPWDLREQAIMNPSLQRFYRGLEAAALGMIYSVQESELSDTTRYPEYSALANRDESDELHAYLQSVQGATGFDGAGAGAGRAAPKAGTKRKAEGPADGGAEEIDEVDQISRGTLGKLTVDALKGVCRKRKLAVSGTKDVLVARIEQDVNKKGK